MILPPNHQWIETIGPLPKILATALQYYGVKEYPGQANNPVIMEMAKGLGLGKIFKGDSMAWCAVFINHILRITGKPINLKPKDKYDLMRAMKTAETWPSLSKDEWKLGDIIILSRDGGGHVFIAISETDKGTISGIGGNQSNAVTIAEFDPDRIVAVKRFYATAPPPSVKRYFTSSTGLLSTNEA